MSETPALALRDIRRTFRQGDADLEVLRGVSLSVGRGEIIALVGPSGAGKSTLLHIAGLLERVDAGEVHVDGVSCADASETVRTRTRRTKLGFVYQAHHLLPEFSALENVVMPQLIAGAGRAEARERARELLLSLGLGERLTHRPARLSGGEQQRVAIARALANRPLVLLTDEPTGNLDPRTADRVLDEMMGLIRGRRLAALVATHNPRLAARMDRIVTLDNGIVA